METMEHPNVIQVFQVTETTENIYTRMEHVSGESYSSPILEVNGMQEQEAQRAFSQITCTVHYCHEKYVVHRDPKPENILVNARANIKLCDFDLSCRFTAEHKLDMFCSTLPYCVPELYQLVKYDGSVIDLWNLGVLLFHGHRLPPIQSNHLCD
ncbi:MAP/microtubule affinity-regulating kinase 4 [Sciurus carolinensis]|uniref:non-specific serine/threonine protein kinase n=1 Tax=Sciurus carolinensis TaxID=30640 RepID=A0AA41MEV9_SCICA|nr:MAP/microtubule affinity-regulating kinase 4 [Sciurus carolinensis]